MGDNGTDVVIVGAGPYGLSIAAHLRAAGVKFRIFGTPMRTWCSEMPDGMLLKSDAFASNLSDPGGAFTLQYFCAASGIPYHHTNIPVTLETFRAYGLAFQKHMVPELEDTQVESIAGDGDGFLIRVATGATVRASRVVVAVGISHFAYVPSILRDLPAEYVTHSLGSPDPSTFRGRRVAVIGAGASAIDLAVLLKEAGADASLVSRRSSLKFNDPPPAGGPSVIGQLRSPASMIGPGWKSRFYTDLPWLFRHLPVSTRMRIVRGQKGSAGGWPMKERFVGKVPAVLGREIQGADVRAGRVRLLLGGPSATREYVADHVVAATGYRVDLRRLRFLDPGILRRIRAVEHAPVLASDFESSVRGVYFVGAASADTFGPLMRFACGADWTARRILGALTTAVSVETVEAPAATARQSLT